MASSNSIQERFWSKTQLQPNQCVIWTASLNNRGYGQFGIGRKLVLSHRFSWESANGPIPHGMLVLHSCDTPACVNVSHLFLGTQSENVADMVSKGRQSRGTNRPTSKLTESEVISIRKEPGTTREIATRFNISHQHVSLIRRKGNWKHVE